MARPYIVAISLGLGWMVSPDVLVRLGGGVAENQSIFLAALAFAVLLIARGTSLVRHPELRSDGRCSQTDLLIQGLGRLPAMSLILASRVTLVLIVPTALLALSGSGKLMTTTELKDMLGSQDLVILDVRSGRDWSASEVKITGAVRANGDDFGNWGNNYPKEKTIVLYCA